MSVTAFLNQYAGGRVDFDGAYGYQCVDLIREWWKFEAGVTNTGGVGSAIDYWRSTPAGVLAFCTRVEGSDAIAGDVVIINPTANNPYGHIGVGTGNVTDSTVEIVEQNGSDGSGSGEGGNAIRTRYVARSRVAGLLRLQQSVSREEEEMIKDSDNEYARWQKAGWEIRGRELSRDAFREAAVGRTWLQALEILSDDPEADAVQQTQDVGRTAIKDQWEQQINTLQDQVKIKEAAAVAAQAAADEARAKEDELDRQLTALQAELETEKAKVPVTVITKQAPEAGPAEAAPAVASSASVSPAVPALHATRNAPVVKGLRTTFQTIFGGTVVFTGLLADPNIQALLSAGLSKYVAPALLGLGLSSGLVSLVVNLIEDRLLKRTT